MEWAKSKESRDQLVLFPHRLDEVIGKDHRVRVLDSILSGLDWSEWEAEYELKLGQPPIHPRVVASVILYGLLLRIRSSRALEEALQVRMDFRWLVEGRTIDHTTLSEFRRKNPDALKKLFVQTGLVARQMGCLALAGLAFDGTRIRSNNRRSGSKTPEELLAMKKELAEKYDTLEAQATANDQAEDEQFGTAAAHSVSDQLADITKRQQQIAQALQELETLESQGKEVPKRIPTTDPDSRIMPNKEGGFAPNYTPIIAVDIDSGMIVSADVLNSINEDHMLVPTIKDVQANFEMDTPPSVALADGLMATGGNIAACEAEKIAFYSPIKSDSATDNPAIRADPKQPVPAEARDRLPTNNITYQGQKRRQLDKAAFIYDESADCYWCPEGKPLKHTTNSKEESGRGATRLRERYTTSVQMCADCPLMSLCIGGNAKVRSISREQHEVARQKHAQKMSSAEAKAIYARRAPINERPFAVIKQQFGVRQFLLRGKQSVQQEWHWLTTAYNLTRLIGLIAQGVGPPRPAHETSPPP